MLMLAMVMSVAFAGAASAADSSTKEIELAPGYKIIVPKFIDYKTVQSIDADEQPFEVKAIFMETPQKNADGVFPIFEIVTTDAKADRVDSYPGVYGEGQLGNFEGTFKDGKLMYSPRFAIKGELSDIVKDSIVFSLNFMVFDKEDNMPFSSEGLYFVFVNNGDTASSSNGEEKTPPVATEVPSTPAASAATAEPTAAKVLIDGKDVAFEAYEIDGYNYFKLRDLAMALNGSEKQFQVGWDEDNNAISLTTGEAYTPAGNELSVSDKPASKQAAPTASKVYINGKEVAFTAYTIDDLNYFKLRDIGEVINFFVGWDEDANSISLDTPKEYQK